MAPALRVFTSGSTTPNFSCSAGVSPSTLKNLQTHERGGRVGDLFFGVGRIIAVRGDGPAGLALHVDQGHLERTHRGGGFVVLGDVQAGGGQGIEIGGEFFAHGLVRACRSTGPGRLIQAIKTTAAAIVIKVIVFVFSFI